jgi:hypothetical protein
MKGTYMKSLIEPPSESSDLKKPLPPTEIKDCKRNATPKTSYGVELYQLDEAENIRLYGYGH